MGEKSNSHINLYSMFLSKEEKKKTLDKMLDTTESDIDEILINKLSEKYNGENIFILDSRIKEERDKRLNEKDKIYKFKKHYFLKDSYEKIKKEDSRKMEIEFQNEQQYLKSCLIAENKFKDGSKLNYNDAYYLLKRNYPLLLLSEQKQIENLKTIYNILNLSAILSTFCLISFANSAMLFFQFKIFRSTFITYSCVGFFGIGLYYNVQSSMKNFYALKVEKFLTNAKDRIINKNNEYKKTPYDRNEKEYKPEFDERNNNALYYINFK